MRMQLSFGRSAVTGLIGLLAMACAATNLQAQFPTPEVTKEHKVLKKDVGVWEGEMKLWMAPDQEPMVSKGTERNRMLGGFWLLSNYTADLGGQEFRGHGQFGYDVKKKKYVGTWVDSMTTSISTMEGTYDEAKDEMTMFMTSIDPESGKEVKAKSVTKYTGKNTRLFTMYMADPSGGDAWMKSMEISYKRNTDASKNKKSTR